MIVIHGGLGFGHEMVATSSYGNLKEVGRKAHALLQSTEDPNVAVI